jgi:hypothetical protein
MSVSIDALDLALLLMDNWEHNRRTELKPGHWLHILSPRSLPGAPLYPSWTWQVVEGEGDQLMLRADGLAEQLVLTQDLADELIIFTPSERVFLADYLEVLSWYRACRWGPCLLDNLDQGGITVTADRYGSRLNKRVIRVIPVADMDQPEVVWLHLVELLYALTHPKKAKAMGHEISEQERTAFIRQMRRKLAKLAVV